MGIFAFRRNVYGKRKHNGQLPGPSACAACQKWGHRCFGSADHSFLPLIKNRAARYSFVGLEQDDFVQEGLIGLFTAVKNYDAGRSASFRTYANLCIHSRMVSCLNDLLSKKHLPLNDYLPIDSLNTSHQEILSQGESDPLEMYLRREEAQIRQEKIKTLLSGLEQETLTLYLSGHSYEEMAKLLHCTTKAVDNALQRVRRKLRDSQQD